VNREDIVQPRSNGSKPIRVLMADPDPSIHSAYRWPLLEEGFEVTPALSGLECFERMIEYVPDVLVLEPQLPWGGGAGVLAMMGVNPALANVPVMMLTSCRDPQVLEEVSRFPIGDYQIKPLSPDRLVGRLRTLLNHPRLRFTMAEQNGRLECSIARRTGGRIYDLHVESIGGRVIVHGRAESHHVKQLALAAVLEAFEASESQSERVELDIEVAPDDNWQARRGALSETRDVKSSHELASINELDLTSELALTKEN
jgi:DNA-binding response OmpR family regulator